MLASQAEDAGSIHAIRLIKRQWLQKSLPFYSTQIIETKKIPQILDKI